MKSSPNRCVPVFLVGTLRHRSAVASLLSPYHRAPATTRGRAYRMPAGQAVLALDGDDEIVGQLVQDVGFEALPLIDMYEGVGEGLSRRATVHVSVAGSNVDALTWVAVEPERRAGVRVPGKRLRAEGL